MAVFCGIDWAEAHHDVALVDETGNRLVKLRISNDAEGYRQLLEVLAEHGDTPAAPVPVTIETGRGPSGRCSTHRHLAGVRDQPAGHRTLPRPAQPLPRQVRSRRRSGPGQHRAQRRRGTPAAACRQSRSAP